MDYVSDNCVEFTNNPIFQIVAFNVIIGFIVWRNMQGEGGDAGGGGGAEGGAEG